MDKKFNCLDQDVEIQSSQLMIHTCIQDPRISVLCVKMDCYLTPKLLSSRKGWKFRTHNKLGSLGVPVVRLGSGHQTAAFRGLLYGLRTGLIS